MAARSNDELAFLQALRDRLALAIDHPETPVKDLSPLTRRLQEVVDRIAGEEARKADEAAKAEMAADSDDSFDPNDL